MINTDETNARSPRRKTKVHDQQAPSTRHGARVVPVAIPKESDGCYHHGHAHVDEHQKVLNCSVPSALQP